jgi:hypothetical protein
MLDPSLPAGTPFAAPDPWESPRVRHNSSQAIVGRAVELGADDPHLESATPLRGPAGRRRGRIFSIFSLVRFKNSACTPSTGGASSGTCYLATQCSDRVSWETEPQPVECF